MGLLIFCLKRLEMSENKHNVDKKKDKGMEEQLELVMVTVEVVVVEDIMINGQEMYLLLEWHLLVMGMILLMTRRKRIRMEKSKKKSNSCSKITIKFKLPQL